MTKQEALKKIDEIFDAYEKYIKERKQTLNVKEKKSKLKNIIK